MPRKRLGSREEGEASALRLLGRRDHSREEMRRKLIQRGLAGRETDEVLAKLAARGLLDDDRYARHLASLYAGEKLWGPQRIMQRLLQKGISPETAREAAGHAEEDAPSRERLRKVLRLQMKGQTMEAISPLEKRRLGDYLRRRGFRWEEILDALGEEGPFEP